MKSMAIKTKNFKEINPQFDRSASNAPGTDRIAIDLVSNNTKDNNKGYESNTSSKNISVNVEYFPPQSPEKSMLWFC